MRVVTWNLNGARASRQPAWEYLLELKPDIALLQEVGDIPLHVTSMYACRETNAIRQNGQPQRFKTAVLVKGHITNEFAISGGHPYIERELLRFRGNIPAYQVEPEGGPLLNVISVYNPAWPLERSAFAGIDMNAVRLTQQATDVWLSDLLWSRLQVLLKSDGVPWIIGGDFNLSESFDKWRGGPHGNREYLNRMGGLGLVECLRHFNAQLVPTFKNADGGEVLHQIDHVFVSEVLAAVLASATTGSQERVFGSKLSDHLPVITDFELQ
jgi:exonuclease III